MPELASNWQQPISIVIDVLRASSSLVVMLEGGARRVFPVADLDAARAMARKKGALLVGERDGQPPADFDLGNSPLALRDRELAGRDVVFTTSNGTRVLLSVPQSRHILIGCFNNASACCALALKLARRHESMIGLVCAGQEGGFALDDGVCAGFLVDILTRQANEPCRLSEAAWTMRWLHESFDSALQAFEQTASARNLRRVGDEADLSACAMVDTSRVVPVLSSEGFFDAMQMAKS